MGDDDTVSAASDLLQIPEHNQGSKSVKKGFNKYSSHTNLGSHVQPHQNNHLRNSQPLVQNRGSWTPSNVYNHAYDPNDASNVMPEIAESVASREEEDFDQPLTNQI